MDDAKLSIDCRSTVINLHIIMTSQLYLATMPNSVFKTQLDNGLTVILKEQRHAPVAAFFVWYKVGSRNEIPGITGSAHWVEHMMFKGTEKHPGDKLDSVISREGGRWNAFTWMDYTAYFEVMPSDRIDISLALESDRMVNTIMNEEETESERTVIISERHMYENQPMFLLYEEQQAAAFRVHPYHHETIGDEVDLETMTRDDLYAFYKRHYAPNNATAVCVGDFDTSEMLQKIESFFGHIPPQEPPEPITRVEPPQRGERRTTVEGPGETSYLLISYKAPQAVSEDFFPLALLNAAFSGGGSLGMMGSSTTNKSSRLYKSLVATDKAIQIQASLTPTIDPFLFSIIAILHPASTMEALEAAIDAEVERLATEPITQAELDKAIKRAKVQFAYASESISGQARMLGLAETVAGDYRWFENALDQIEAVTLEDIERVREKYLHRQNRTVGRYIPQTANQPTTNH